MPAETRIAILARRFGCTEQQIAENFRATLAQLRDMHAKALASGRKVRGYTAERLAALCTEREQILRSGGFQS